jgi:hypothetical protein
MRETRQQKNARIRELDRRIAEQCPTHKDGIPWWGWVIIWIFILGFIFELGHSFTE